MSSLVLIICAGIALAALYWVFVYFYEFALRVSAAQLFEHSMRKGLYKKILQYCYTIDMSINRVYIVNNMQRKEAFTTINGYIFINSKFIETLEDDEVVAVVAHEAFHYKHQHTKKKVFDIFVMLMLTYISLCLLLTVGAVYLVVIPVLAAMVVNRIKRNGQYEVSADYFAANTVHDGDLHMVSVLKKSKKESYIKYSRLYKLYEYKKKNRLLWMNDDIYPLKK